MPHSILSVSAKAVRSAIEALILVEAVSTPAVNVAMEANTRTNTRKIRSPVLTGSLDSRGFFGGYARAGFDFVIACKSLIILSKGLLPEGWPQPYPGKVCLRLSLRICSRNITQDLHRLEHSGIEE
jgi:hypothetical protein